MEKEQVLISVIVPIFKVEKYLPECIESIIHQTYKNLEIILVDDGSVDRCPKICDEYQRCDDRIKVIHKKNGGLVNARKSGIKIATGDYITFVDGDDRINETMYERMVDSLDSRMPDILCCGFIQETKSGGENYIHNKLPDGYYEKNRIESEIVPNFLAFKNSHDVGIESSVFCKLYKKRLLEENMDKVMGTVVIGEDTIFTLACITMANAIQIENSIMDYFYRYNLCSITKAYDGEYIKKLKNLFENLDLIEDTVRDKSKIERTIIIHKMYMLICYGMSNEAQGSPFFYLYRLFRYFHQLINNYEFYKIFLCRKEYFNIFQPKKRILINLIKKKKILRAVFICTIPRKIIETWSKSRT